MKVWLLSLVSLDVVGDICMDDFPCMVGRHSDNDCRLPLAFISRRHCRFTRDDEDVLVQDLESYNGTFVNGTPASVPMRIRDGDELRVGPLTFRVAIPPDNVEVSESCLAATP